MFTSLLNATYQPPAFRGSINRSCRLLLFFLSIAIHLQSPPCVTITAARLIIAKIIVIFHLQRSHHASLNHVYNFLFRSAVSLVALQAPRSSYADPETCSLLCGSCRWRLYSRTLSYDNTRCPDHNADDSGYYNHHRSSKYPTALNRDHYIYEDR